MMASASTVPVPTGLTDHVFPARPEMLREIRAFVARLATAAGIPDAERHQIVLATNEAATNAVEHSGSNVVRVGWEHGDQGVWITVADDGVFKAVNSAADGGGWGLSVVLMLADEVTVRAGRRGERAPPSGSTSVTGHRWALRHLGRGCSSSTLTGSPAARCPRS